MKRRQGFVSNSSSSSFVLFGTTIEEDKINEIEVKDAEVVTPDEPKKELTLEETKEAVAALRNVPYVKIKDAKGDVVNPITKEEPYRTMFSNGKQRRDAIKRVTKNPKNNKKGARVVVTNLGGGQFTKSHVRAQHIEPNETVVYDNELKPVGKKSHKPRTIIHNDFKH